MNTQETTEQSKTAVASSDWLGHVPKRGALCGHQGKQAGLSAALREMKVGDERDCPFEWEQGFRSAAERIGIQVVTRRLPNQTGVRVYRVA